VARIGISASERPSDGVSDPSRIESRTSPGVATASPSKRSGRPRRGWLTVTLTFSKETGARSPPSVRYRMLPFTTLTRERRAAVDAGTTARPLGRVAPDDVAAAGPRLAQFQRPVASSISSMRGLSSVRSVSSTRPDRRGRSRMRMRPSATDTNGPEPNAGSSAMSRPRSFTVGSGSGATDSEVNLTCRPIA